MYWNSLLILSISRVLLEFQFQRNGTKDFWRIVRMGNCQRNIWWRSTVKYFLVVTEESLQNMFLELLTRTGTKQTLTSIKDLGAATLINHVDHVGHVCSLCRSCIPYSPSRSQCSPCSPCSPSQSSCCQCHPCSQRSTVESVMYRQTWSSRTVVAAKKMMFIDKSYIKKLSGLMSLWMKFLLWIYSMRLINWSASNKTVFKLNLREQKLNKSSRLGPSSSITITL